MGDLLDPETGLLGEYDGSGHRQERQHALDNAREEGLEDAGLTVVRVSNPDLGVFRRRTRMRLESGQVRARRTPGGSGPGNQDHYRHRCPTGSRHPASRHSKPAAG